MSHLEGPECIEALIPFVKSFSFTWFHLQAAKRRYQKQHETPMPIEMERVMKDDFMTQRYADKIKWTVRILAKLRKDIKRECRSDLVKTISEGNVQSPCIISNADTKNKMRRIDCLRQADKVWRLDVVMVVLFRGIPLESTDGERLSKCKDCQHPALCINPYHIVLHVKELEVYLVNFINNTRSIPVNIIPSVFSTDELQHMATSSISEGGSTREVLGADYLGSMLKMETDEYNDVQPASTGQQPDLLKMCRTRKPSLSTSPRTAKRRRTLNNNCSADEADANDLNDGPISTYDVYESKISNNSTTTKNELPSSSTSNTFTNYQGQQQQQQQSDDMTGSKPLLESNKMEPATPRPPYSQIGIHNHVSLNLHFNNQQQQQQQQQKLVSNSTSVQSNNSESKIHSERFIESVVQNYNDNQQQQQQQRTSSHPHTIEYFHQTNPSIESIAKNSSQIFCKPATNASVNILSSREQTTSTYESSPSYLQTKPQVTQTRIASAADRVLPAFHTFSELKSYLQTIGLDVELVPASSSTQSNETLTRTPIETTNIYQTRSNTINVSQTPQQPKIVMLSNTDGSSAPTTTTNSRPNESKSIRSSVPPNVLTEKLLEYTSSMRRSPSKMPIVTEIANLLSISTNKESTPIVQQVTRQTLLPPPPPPPLTTTTTTTNNRTSTTTPTTVYHSLTNNDKVSTMVKTDLIHDDPHLHDREVEELMNMGTTSRTSKTRKTVPEKSIVLESGSASNSNDSHVSSNSSTSNSSTNVNNHSTCNGTIRSTSSTATSTPTNNLNSSNNNTKNSTNLNSTNDSRNICDLLLMLYEHERTRSTHLQKQIEQVTRQQRSRNSSGQSHSSESQTGLETPQGPTHGTVTSTRMLSPATWLPNTTGKEKPLLSSSSSSLSTGHLQTSPPESQDCSPPDPNKSGLSPTKVVQFSQSIGSAQNLIPRPVPMLATNDGLVRHTSSSSAAATPTGSNSSSNNGVLYTPGNRIFQSPLGQAFAALSPALSPFLSPSTSRAGTPSELMIIPADLLNVLNSRIWSEDELLQAFVNHLDSGGV